TSGNHGREPPSRHCGTGIGPTEILPAVGVMLTSPARLCRPCRLAGPAHAAATAGFSIQERKIKRETDCLLEGDGFEPSVPRHGELMKFALTPCRSEQDSNFRSPATASSVGAL